MKNLTSVAPARSQLWARSRWVMILCGVGLVAASLHGCTTTKHSAPVEERSTGMRTSTSVPSTSATVGTAPIAAASGVRPAAAANANASNADKPGYYTVKQGDTLYRISLEHGQGYRDVAAWNNLEDVGKINIGQVLRIVPPDSAATTVAVRPASAVQSQPLPASSVGVKPSAASAVAASTAPTAQDSTGIVWTWPSSGKLIEGFNDKSNKGLDIAGKAGDPVVAAADGKVVYTGSALRGYGNLVMIKHSETWLTAYAHNRAINVKELQDVKRGQKIAELGNSDSDAFKLHFEIRKQGKPVDPAKILPER